jgi:hypothetical protein
MTSVALFFFLSPLVEQDAAWRNQPDYSGVILSIPSLPDIQRAILAAASLSANDYYSYRTR